MPRMEREEDKSVEISKEKYLFLLHNLSVTELREMPHNFSLSHTNKHTNPQTHLLPFTLAAEVLASSGKAIFLLSLVFGVA